MIMINEEQCGEVRSVRAQLLQQAEQGPEIAPAILINEIVYMYAMHVHVHNIFIFSIQCLLHRCFSTDG